MSWLRRLLGLGARAAEEDERDAAAIQDLRKVGRDSGAVAADAEREARRLSTLTDEERAALLAGARAAIPRVHEGGRFTSWDSARAVVEMHLAQGRQVTVSGPDAVQEFTVTWSDP